MPVYNITVDDISPMFVYSSGWHDSSTEDPDHAQYLNDSFHATNTTGSSVSFKFNGSAVWLSGAKRSNHGNYAVTLDGNSQEFNGFAEDPGVFQTLIFSQTQLGTGPHDLFLRDNSSDPLQNWVDVDFLTFTTGDGDSSTVLSDSSVDDGAPTIAYSSGWTNVPNGLITSYFNQTFHETNETGAQAQITFYGSAIALYGATSANHGTYTVSLDGGTPTQLIGHAPAFRPQTLLYYASGLANTTHVVSLVNTASSGVWLDFDMAVVSQYFQAVLRRLLHVQRTMVLTRSPLSAVLLLLYSGFSPLASLHSPYAAYANTARADICSWLPCLPLHPPVTALWVVFRPLPKHRSEITPPVMGPIRIR